MITSRPRATLTEILRATIEQSGLTRYRIAKETRIPESHLGRFIRGEMSIRLDKADRLAAYLGLQLEPAPDAVPPAPTPKHLARPMLAKLKKYPRKK